MRIHVSVIGGVMLLIAVSTAAAQQPKTESVQDEVLATDTIHFTQRVRVSSNSDPRDAELVLLARRLLSQRGSIEIDVRVKTFTVTDRRAAIESIHQLVESYTLKSSSTYLADPDNAKSSAAIRAVLDAQVAAWNRGDLEGYMDGYDRSKDTAFISGERFIRGWQEVLERYKKTYDTPEKMGVLTFSEVEVAVVGKDAALVFGRWHLRRVNDEPHGRFTLLFKKTKAGWRIVYDHTSSA